MSLVDLTLKLSPLFFLPNFSLYKFLFSLSSPCLHHFNFDKLDKMVKKPHLASIPSLNWPHQVNIREPQYHQETAVLCELMQRKEKELIKKLQLHN